MPDYKKMAQKQDKRVAKALGFRIRPNSGAVAGHRGDLGSSSWFIETKTKESEMDDIEIHMKWLEKAKKQAQAMGKPYWALVISNASNIDYAVLDEATFGSVRPELRRREADLGAKDRELVSIPQPLIDYYIQKNQTQLGFGSVCIEFHESQNRLFVLTLAAFNEALSIQEVPDFLRADSLFFELDKY